MCRVVLLFNPVSGRHPQKRLSIIRQAAEAIRATGCDVTITATDFAGSAGGQAFAACHNGADIIFACGGDGTIHDVLQGIVYQPHTALGILPLGSANTLARHIGLPLDPIQAALAQLHFTPRTIPLGQVNYRTGNSEENRYFLIMAGTGPDGALVRTSLRSTKHRLGRFAYYLRAGQLFLTPSFFRPLFAPCLTRCTLLNGDTIVRHTTGVMAVRISDLGGLFGPLVRGADIEHAHLHVTLIKSPGAIAFLSWFASSWTRTSRWNPFVETCEATEVRCSAATTQPIDVQADGEWLGETPMSLRIAPNALRLLLPSPVVLSAAGSST